MNKERLLQLAEHLETGELGHEKFDFSQYNNSTNGCGTAGCAIGECPILWPKDWRFNIYGTPVLKTIGITIPSCMEFFDVEEEGYDHLFEPSGQKPNIYGGVNLSKASTKEQVASNIRAFVAKKEES